MTALTGNKQFLIDDDYVFGLGCPIFIDSEGGFDPGDNESLTQDAVNPITGARVFGRDRIGAGSWQWTLHVDRTDEATALAELAAMGAVWRDPARRKPDAITALRYRLAGRDRVVFGRPRRFSGTPENRIDQGYIPVLASFDLVDEKHYGAVENASNLVLVPPTPGGFAVPITTPLTIDIDATYIVPGKVEVGGDTETSLEVTFRGPITSPSVTVGDVVIGLEGSIGVGGEVTVTSHPWAMRVTRTGDAAGAKLSRDTRLTRALVGPGAYQAVLRGVDYTGTATATVRWRDAFTTL